MEIPEGVWELTPKQYEYYCFLAFALGAGAIDNDFFRVRWFSYIVGLGKANFTLLKKVHADELNSQMDEALAGYFVAHADEHDRLSLDFTTPRNLLPTYRNYKGPGDFLEGVTFGEFTECLTIAAALTGADEQEVADGYAHIARILYHIPEGDTVPDLLAFHAPTLFASVWSEIQRGPIDINGQKIDFRIIFKGGGSAKPDDHTGWTGITFEVASAGLFGSVKEVEAADMWAVLIYLYKCKFEYLNEKTKNK